MLSLSKHDFLNRPQQNYIVLVRQLKEEIHSARIRASLSANVHLLVLYWKIGKAIAEQEILEGWGTKIVTQLARDLRSEFPDMKGISPRNLRYMRDFAVGYPQFLQQSAATLTPVKIPPEGPSNKNKPILQQPAAKLKTQLVQVPLAKLGDNEFVQQPAAQLPWFHICTLLDKVKDSEERLFYMQQAAENG